MMRTPRAGEGRRRGRPGEESGGHLVRAFVNERARVLGLVLGRRGGRLRGLREAFSRFGLRPSSVGSRRVGFAARTGPGACVVNAASEATTWQKDDLAAVVTVRAAAIWARCRIARFPWSTAPEAKSYEIQVCEKCKIRFES